MMNSRSSGHNNDDTALGDLLRRDAVENPLKVSPWFAARTTAIASATRRPGRFWNRWFLPVPLAALCALVLLAVQNGGLSHFTGSSTASDSQFEQDMELLIADLD